METINKLLKKQAPKINRKSGLGGTSDGRPDPSMCRWVSDKNGSRLALPGVLLNGHYGLVLQSGLGLPSAKMVEEIT